MAGVAAVLLASCASGASSPSASAAASASAAGATVKTAKNANLGTILVAANGMTLYVFDKDAKDTSNCSGACATTWPPLTASGTPTGNGISGTLGTITRSDGGKQVTLNGKPLYYYKNDQKPGDAIGNGINGIWHVVTNP
ncbi:MAG: hypothetical protein KGJ98_05825 [Chloroflexota bacterium]|nr:hypothetical protein [Chloroflexota bacterium]